MTQVVGFEKFEFHAENVGAGDLSLPQNKMPTERPWWLTVPSTSSRPSTSRPNRRSNGLFGLTRHPPPRRAAVPDVRRPRRGGVDRGQHAPARALPPRNLQPASPPRNRPPCSRPDFEPNIFIYDNLSRRHRPEPGPLPASRTGSSSTPCKTIEACPCAEGCPSCVGPAHETGRLVALDILKKLKSS